MHDAADTYHDPLFLDSEPLSADPPPLLANSERAAAVTTAPAATPTGPRAIPKRWRASNHRLSNHCFRVFPSEAFLAHVRLLFLTDFRRSSSAIEFNTFRFVMVGGWLSPPHRLLLQPEPGRALGETRDSFVPLGLMLLIGLQQTHVVIRPEGHHLEPPANAHDDQNHPQLHRYP